jgi:phosphoglycerate dehydrogenase-like enzyme
MSSPSIQQYPRLTRVSYHVIVIRNQRSNEVIMTDQGVAAADAGGERRLYLLLSESTFAPEAAAAVGAALPPGWLVADEPDDATVIIATEDPVGADVIEKAGGALRVIATTEAHADGLATHRDVRVVTIPEESDLSGVVVAEFAVTMILALSRNLIALARTTPEAEWKSGRDTPILTDQATYVYNWTALQDSGHLVGKTVGIVGIGKIGATLAEMLGPHRARLLYTQRNRLPAAEEQRLGIEWRDLDDLLRESDVVTLHHRLQEGQGGNERQIGSREFALMKPTAFLVNTARGRILDEDALVEALSRRRIAGAALDVFHYEPLPKDHPLLSLAGDNVILTPHIAAGSEGEYWKLVLRIALDAYAALPDHAAA